MNNLMNILEKEYIELYTGEDRRGVMWFENRSLETEGGYEEQYTWGLAHM
jgi:hypothetical protein